MFGRKNRADASEASKPPAATSVSPPARETLPEVTSSTQPAFGTVTPEPSGSPPLFVKIDKYTDIQTHLQELKSHTGNMRKTLDKLAESYKRLQMSLSMSYNTLERITQTLGFLESKFSGKVLRTHGVSAPALPSMSLPRPASREPDEEVEGYLKDINSQMRKIKNELDNVK